MDKALLQYKHLVDIGDGQYVERDVLGIIERIRDYDPNIRVKYLNRAESVEDAPWCITETCKDGVERLCFFAWTMDERVLERLYQADTYRFDVLGRVDEKNALAQLAQERRYREELDEAKDIVDAVLKSNKGRYTVRDGEKVIHIDDDPTSGPAKVVYD